VTVSASVKFRQAKQQVSADYENCARKCGTANSESHIYSVCETGKCVNYYYYYY